MIDLIRLNPKKKPARWAVYNDSDRLGEVHKTPEGYTASVMGCQSQGESESMVDTSIDLGTFRKMKAAINAIERGES